MSDDVTRPWWYSGDEDPEPDSREQDSPGIDVMAMLSGAMRMMDWAAGAVVEPHANHQDPSAHPDCLICRTLAVVTDRTGMSAPSRQSPASEPRPSAEPVRWIPITD